MGGAPSPVPLRSMARFARKEEIRTCLWQNLDGRYARLKKEERKIVGGTPARPNKFRKRKRFASKPFKFASFVSPPPKKFALQYFSGTPFFRFALFCRGGSPCPHDNFHLLCVNNNSCGVPCVDKKSKRVQGDGPLCFISWIKRRKNG